MHYLSTRILLVVSLLLTLNLCAQPVKKLGFTWDKQKMKYATAELITVSTATNTERVMTALQMIWVLPTTLVPGHWRRPKRGEVEARNRQTALFMYPVNLQGYSSYSPGKRLNLATVNENNSFLARPEIINEGLIGINGRMNVHYINKLNLGMISLAREQDHVIVVDTLYVPPARKLGNVFIVIDQLGKPFLKLIANTIVFESPVMLSLSGKDPADFIFSYNNIYLKTIYDGLAQQDIQSPPFTMVAEGLNINVYRQYNGELEKTLLNRLYIKLMEQCFNNLSATEDDWVKDKLVERFQQYRFLKLKPEILGTDLTYQTRMNRVVEQFNDLYSNFKVKKLRDLDGIKIIADGDVNQLLQKPLKYFAFPTIAELQPLIRDSALGSIVYTGSGDADIKVSVETALGYDETQFAAAAAKLAGKGVTVQKKLLQNIITLDEQPLKINGKTIGRIIPVGNQIIRLEMNLVEGAKTIAELFPKAGHPVFNLDYKIGGEGELVSQPVSFVVDSSLLARLDYTQPLKSFNVLERTALTGNLKISSAISAARVKEGALNYLEIILEIKFTDRSVLYGPYRLSGYNTLASELTVPFLVHTDKYRIVISGRAVYDNGEINIKPFESKTVVIVLEDAILNTP